MISWWLVTAAVLYLVGWAWLGAALASTTDESRVLAFLSGAAWPWLVILVLIGH